LGYRIRKISKFLYRFFFACTNFFYFHVPFEVLFTFKKRRILFVGKNLALLKNVFVHFLFLKKLVPYRIRGLLYPKQIITMKPGKKPF